jgi:hypothetical protein
VLNQYRILYFTIIIRKDSEHVTGCIGVEEKQKKNVPNILPEIFPKRGGDLSYDMF